MKVEDYEKMTLHELWKEYQRLGIENANMSVKMSINHMNQDSIVSWIMGKHEEEVGK
jgi:hypothetical protein